MDLVKDKSLLASAIACALGLGFSSVTMAANDISINLDPTDLVDSDGTGGFTTTGDPANLNVVDITTAWSSPYAVTITTSGMITLDATLDFDTFSSSSLTLDSLGAININAGISDSNSLSADSLTLTLSSVAGVNLNDTIGEYTNTTISGGLNIGDSGIYKLVNATDSLTVDSITKNPDGSFEYTAGSLTLNNTLNIGSGELLGDAVVLGSAQTLQTDNQVISSGASLTQDGGSNTVTNTLTIYSGGSYVLNGGSLQASSIVNDGTVDVAGNFTVDAGNSYTQSGDLNADSITANGSMSQTGGNTTVTNNIDIADTGSYELSGGALSAADINRSTNGDFIYTGGDLTLSSGNLAIEENGLLGATASIGAGQNLQTATQSVGMIGLNSGTVDQTDGSNTVVGALTVNTGGTYNLSGGVLSTGSVAVDGTVNQSAGDHSVSGGLAVNSLGGYELSGGSLSSDTLSADGSFTQSAGSNTVTGAMSVTTFGSYDLSGSDASTLASGSLTTDGDFSQTGGNNTVDGALTIGATGSYTLNSGSLTTGTLDNSAGGTFVWTNGKLRMTGDDLVVDSTGLLGQSLVLTSTRELRTVNQTVGTVAANSGSVVQELSSKNTVDGTLTVNAGGTYDLSSANLTAGSVVNDGVITQSGGSKTNIAGAFTQSAGGAYNMNGGTFTAGSIDNSGTFTQSVGNSVVNGALSINSTGLYTQSFGKNEVAGALSIAAGGTYDLTSGVLTADSFDNNGTMTQNGTVTVANALNINTGASYDVIGGTLSAGSIDNTGTFDISRKVSVTGDMTVGTAAPASGSVTTSGTVADVDVGGTLTVNAGGSYTNQGSSAYTGSNLSAANIINSGAMVQSGGADTSTSTLTMNAGSTYDLSGGYESYYSSNDSNLNATTIDNAGTITQTGGRTSASTLTISSGGLYDQSAGNNNASSLVIDVGGSYQLSGPDYDGYPDSVYSKLTSSNQTIGGAMIQSGGYNGVTNTLAINTGGSYVMSGGTLRVGNVVSDGTFTYTGGELRLTDSSLTVDSTGLLGATVTIGASQIFSAVSQTVGNLGTITQTGGKNIANTLLTIDAGGTYNLDGGILRATDVINNGTLNYTGGSVQLTDADLNIDSSGLLGANINITVDDAFESNNQTVGTAALSSGSVIQTGGSNQIDNDLTIDVGGSYTMSDGSNQIDNILTINAGGSYTMSGGNLSAYTIINNGAFNYTGGGVTFTVGDIDINSAGLLGDTVNMAAGEIFGATNMTVGTAALDSGSVNQTGGTNTVTNVLAINAGGSYTMSGGSLVAGSVVNNGAFNYSGGAVLLTDDDLAIDSSGLLGDTVSISNQQQFGSDNQSIGTAIADSGSVIHDGGYNIVDGVLTVAAGGSYDLTGGTYSGYSDYSRVSADQLNVAGMFNQHGGVSGVLGMTVINGGLFTLSSGDNFTNTFTIDAGGTYNLDGGDLSIYTNALNNGTFNFNSGSLYASYDFTMAAGELLGADESISSGKSFRVGGDLNINTGASLLLNGGYLSATTINNSGSFTFSSGTLSLASLSVSETGLLGKYVNLKSNRNVSIGTATVDAGATLNVASGQYSQISTLNNDGNVNVRSGSNLEITSTVNNTKTVNIESGASLANHYDGDKTNFSSYIQTAGTTILNGELYANSVLVQGGQLLGSGTVKGDVTVTDGGRIKPGNSYGDLEVGGQLTLSTNGTLLMEVGDDPDSVGNYIWDQMVAESYNMTGGSLKFTLQDSVTLGIFMDEFSIDDFLLIGSRDESYGYLATGLSLTSLANLNIRAYDTLAGEWSRLMLDENGGFDIYVSSVPVPAAIWLFSSGLLGLLAVSRRRAC